MGFLMGFLSFGEKGFFCGPALLIWSRVAYMVAGTPFWGGYELSSKSQQRLKATIFSHDTLNGVAIATLSAPVSFCPKNKYPHLQPLK